MFSISIGKYLLNLILKLLLIWGALVSIFSVLRLSSPFIGIDISLFGTFVNGYMFLMFLMVFLYLLIQVPAGLKGFLSHEVLVTLCLLIVSIVWGVYKTYPYLNMLKHVYLVFFSLLFFCVGKKIFFLTTVPKFNSYFKLIFFVNILSIILFYLVSIFYKLYPGYGTQGIVYSAIWFLSFGKFFYFFLSTLIIAIEGKRSLQLSFFLCLILYVFARYFKSKSVVLKALFYSFFIVLLFLKLYDILNFDELIGLSRIKYINPFSEEFDLYMGSSGRFDEYISLYKEFRENSINYYLGMGSGFSYEWTLSYDNDFLEKKIYLHNVPVMIYMLLGPFYVLFFYLLSFVNISRVIYSSNSYREGSDNFSFFVANSSFFFLVSGLFSLNALTDPIGWVFLGICYQSVISNRSITVVSG